MKLALAFARPSAILWLMILLAGVIHLTSARWHIRYGGFNTDEGFYAIATRAVAQGEMPYRDFGFTQTPLVLYANALPLQLAGFGLFSQRAINGLWGAIALALAATWLARRTRPGWALAFAGLFSLSAPWMYFIHLGKTYGFTTLLVTVASWAFLAMDRGPRRNFVLGILAVLGVGTRLPAAPFFGMLWLLGLWPGGRPTVRETVAAFAGVVATALVVILPFWLSAPEAVRFWIFDFHRESVPLKDWHVAWTDIASLAPAVWVLAAAGIFSAIRQHCWAAPETGVILAALVTLAANLLPGGAYQEYGVPFLLPLAMASVALVYDGFSAEKKIGAAALAGVVLAAHFFTGPLLLSNEAAVRCGTLSQWLPPHAPAYNRELPTQLDAARQVVERSLAPIAPFIGPNLILAAETGRFVPRVLRMGPFSFTVEIPPERAARLHLATHEQLDAWFADPSVTVLGFFRRHQLNYAWSMPSFDQLRPEFHAQWFAPVFRDFVTAYASGEFLILVRKNPRP